MGNLGIGQKLDDTTHELQIRVILYHRLKKRSEYLSYVVERHRMYGEFNQEERIRHITVAKQNKIQNSHVHNS